MRAFIIQDDPDPTIRTVQALTSFTLRELVLLFGPTALDDEDIDIIAALPAGVKAIVNGFTVERTQ